MPTEPRIYIAEPVLRRADTERRAGEEGKIRLKRISREVGSILVFVLSLKDGAKDPL